MINRIYYFGLLGNLKKNPVGGGQSSARRVVEGLRQAGFEVITTDRHWNTNLTKIGHKLESGFFTLYNVSQLFFKLLFGKRKGSIYLNISYSNVLIPLEYYTGRMAQLLGYKSVLYLKGGRLEDVIKGLKGKRKEMFKKNLDMRELIMLEGECDVERIKAFTTTKVIWFPNYIFEKDIPEQLPTHSYDQIGICHFGRITEDKGVGIVLDTFELLAEKYPKMTLSIVGGIGGVGGGDPVFYENFNRRCRNSKYANRILRVGQSSPAYIKEILQNNHIFLFPSCDPCEGQSNSLNEAMTQGLVPIVSDFHFNRAVVGDDRLVIKGYDACDYANRISEIIDSNQLKELSLYSWNRIKEHFSYLKVNTRICNELKNIE